MFKLNKYWYKDNRRRNVTDDIKVNEYLTIRLSTTDNSLKLNEYICKNENLKNISKYSLSTNFGSLDLIPFDIYLKNNNEEEVFIGNINLNKKDNESSNLSFYLKEEYRNKGYEEEVVGKLIKAIKDGLIIQKDKDGFNKEVNLNLLICVVFCDDEYRINILKSLGFMEGIKIGVYKKGENKESEKMVAWRKEIV